MNGDDGSRRVRHGSVSPRGRSDSDSERRRSSSAAPTPPAAVRVPAAAAPPAAMMPPPAAAAAAPRRPEVFRMQSAPDTARYVPGGQQVIGQRGMEAQMRGATPSARQVRSRAQSYDDTTMGQSHHEVYPTSERGFIANMPSDSQRSSAAQVQSGARTTPAVTPMLDPQGQTAGHTGTYVSPARPRASTHTSGQSRAHDVLRESLRQAVSEGVDGGPLAARAAGAQISGIPTGPQLMRDEGLNGAITNYGRVAFEDAVADDEDDFSSAPNRALYASDIHERREHAKARLRTAEQHHAARGEPGARPPSPPRRSLSQGGGYHSPSSPVRPASPFPDVDGADYPVAEEAAWLTQPFRLAESDRLGSGRYSHRPPVEDRRERSASAASSSGPAGPSADASPSMFSAAAPPPRAGLVAPVPRRALSGSVALGGGASSAASLGPSAERRESVAATAATAAAAAAPPVAAPLQRQKTARKATSSPPRENNNHKKPRREE